MKNSKRLRLGRAQEGVDGIARRAGIDAGRRYISRHVPGCGQPIGHNKRQGWTCAIAVVVLAFLIVHAAIAVIHA